MKMPFAAALALAATAAFAQFPNKPSRSWWASSPAAAPTPRRASCRGRSANRSASRSSSRTAPARAATSPDHAKAAPDGYTIVLANVGALAVNPHILKTPYDPLKDLLPISMAAEFANVLVVQPLPIKTVADYVDYAKKNPGKLTYASSGIGGAGLSELWKSVAKVDIVHVPTRAAARRCRASSAARSTPSSPRRSPRSRRSAPARRAATTGSKRAALMPDVPTIAEAGYAGYEALNWYGFLAPRGTPEGHHRAPEPRDREGARRPAGRRRAPQDRHRAQVEHSRRIRAVHQARIRHLGQGRQRGGY